MESDELISARQRAELYEIKNYHHQGKNIEFSRRRITEATGANKNQSEIDLMELEIISGGQKWIICIKRRRKL